MQLLLKKGADASILSDSTTPMDGDIRQAFDRATSELSLHSSRVLAPPPKFVKDSLFLSIHFEAFGVEALEAKSSANLCIVIQVMNPKAKLVEAEVITPPPIISREQQGQGRHHWWGHTWNMQTPLEALDAGSAAFFDVRVLNEDGKPKSSTSICWSSLTLDENKLKCGNMMLEMFKAPLDLKRKKQLKFENDAFLNAEIFVPAGMGMGDCLN